MSIEPELTQEQKDEKARQYQIQVRVNTIKLLKEHKQLWVYLMSKYPDRTARRRARQDFIKDDKFGTELIDDCIKYHEALAKQEALERR